MLQYGYYSTMRCEIIGQWGNDHKEIFLWIASPKMPLPLVHAAHLRALSSLNTCYRFFSRSWRRHKKTISSIISHRHSLRGHAKEFFRQKHEILLFLDLVFILRHPYCIRRAHKESREACEEYLAYIHDNIRTAFAPRAIVAKHHYFHPRPWRLLFLLVPSFSRISRFFVFSNRGDT